MDLSAYSIIVFDSRGHLATLEISVLRALGVGRMRKCADLTQLQPEIALANADLLVLNLTRADENAYEIVQDLRNESSAADPFIPIIGITPAVSAGRVGELIRAGVDSILTLPLQPATLQRQLAHLISADRRFVRLNGYFGPDRRRRIALDDQMVDRRRKGAVGPNVDVLEAAELAELRRQRRAFGRHRLGR